jgi:hypothetical protein
LGCPQRIVWSPRKCNAAPITKKAVQKKEQRKKPPRPGVETVVVDVIEEPAPGVITVTEIEKTQIAAGRNEPEEC